MSSEWMTLLVSELADPGSRSTSSGPFGSNLVSRDYAESGIPVIRGGNMSNGRWVGGDFAWVGEEKAEELSANLAFPGEIVFTQRGTLGQVCLVPDGPYDKYVLSQSQMKLRVNPSICDPLFMLYQFRSPDQQAYIDVNAIRVGVPHTNLGILRDTPCRVPPLSTQKAIAHILGTLDDKIELNRKTNATLEAMAKALFKSWFVDFDPVRAKAEGRPTGLPTDISDLFPNSFEDSELGEIPRGWEIKGLDEVADFLNGLALQKYPPEDGLPTLPVIKIAQLKKGDSAGADQCSSSLPGEYVVRDGDVLFSWSGSLAVDIWCGGDGALNQHLFKVTSKSHSKWFFYYWVKHHLPDFQEIAKSKATTMGHIQRHHLSAAKAVIPSPSLLGAMDSAFEPLLERSFGLRSQSRELSAVRDTLLPKLISGELRIPDAEKLLEEAGV